MDMYISVSFCRVKIWRLSLVATCNTSNIIKAIEENVRLTISTSSRVVPVDVCVCVCREVVIKSSLCEQAKEQFNNNEKDDIVIIGEERAKR